MEQYIDNIKKQNVQYNIEGSIRKADTTATPDLSVTDDVGNVIMELENGELKTKEFDSRNLHMPNDVSDFDIRDDNGNAIVRFKNGNIETLNHPNFLILTKIEYGGIDVNGINEFSIDSYNTKYRSAKFINTNGATEMCAYNWCYVFKYDSDHLFVSVHYIDAYEKLDISDCTYIKICGSRQSIGNDDIYLGFNGTKRPIQEYNVAMRTPSERLLYVVDGEMFTTALMMLPPNYSVHGKKVPLIVWDSGDGSFKNWNTYEMGTGYERRRIGLEYLRDQGFAVLEIYSWGNYYYEKYPDCGGRSAMPIHTHLATHAKGVEYVCDRYNIDSQNVFHVSKSGSGKMALGYAQEKPNFNLKSIYAFAPVFDDLNFLGIGMRDYRRVLMEELNLQGTETELLTWFNGNTYEQGSTTGQGFILGYNPAYTYMDADDPILIETIDKNRAFVLKNAEKFSKLSVCWRNLIGQILTDKIQDTYDFGATFWTSGLPYDSPQHETDCYNRYNLTMVGSGIPITVVMAKNDEQTPYWNCAEVVSQLRNNGNDAQIVSLTTQGHSAPDMGTGENAVSDITTMCGVFYESVSIGWYLACKDIQERFLSQIDSDVNAYINQN